MKKVFWIVLIFVIRTSAQVGIGTTTPNGALEINSSTNGVLISNVALTSRTDLTTVINPNGGALLAGTLVWNTATAGISPNNVNPGFYYWDGSSWIAIAGDGGKYWTTTGNSGTTAGTNYIGTNDVQDFAVSTSSTERMRFTAIGNIGINTQTPTATSLLTINPNNNAIRSGIDMTLSNSTSAATGINISASSANVNGILVNNTTSSLSSSVYGVGSVLSSSNIVSGYCSYRNNSGKSYGLYGITGTNSSYSSNTNTWAGFLQGRTVISSESSPTSALGTDLEVRNTTPGATAPVTVSLRQTNSLANSGNVLGNLNFGDNYVTTPQAQIQVLRDAAASSSADMPTTMTFSTTSDASASLTERMRINNVGNVGIGTTSPGFTLDVASAGRAINASTSGGTNAAVFGFNTAAGGAGAGGYGVGGQTNQSGSTGVRGEQLNSAGDAISAINFAAIGTGIGSGIYTQTSQSNGTGIDAVNLNTSGTAIYSAGQNASGSYLVAGSGGSFNGVTTGIHARNTSLGISQAIYSDNGGTFCRVNYWNGTTQYKILGSGTVSTIAENINGERVTLHCTEAPEIYFEDYGQGQLINGRVHIDIDPTIAKNITVNEKHPLRVFIQLEGECNGVFVTNKTGNSFDVVELASGQSNAKFLYRIVGNRADEVLPNGRISKNADIRFELAPKELETKETTTIDIGKPAEAKQTK